VRNGLVPSGPHTRAIHGLTEGDKVSLDGALGPGRIHGQHREDAVAVLFGESRRMWVCSCLHTRIRDPIEPIPDRVARSTKFDFHRQLRVKALAVFWRFRGRIVAMERRCANTQSKGRRFRV
jgi:hypothetical protein